MRNFTNILLYLIAGVFLGLIIISQNLSVSLGFAIGIPLLTGAFLSLDFGLALLMIVVIAFQRAQLFSLSLPLFGGGLKPTDMLFLAIMGGWLMRTGFSGKRFIGHGESVPLLIFVFFFVIWAVCCTAIGLFNGHFYKYSLLELRPIAYYLIAIPILSEFDIPGIKRIVHIIILTSMAISLQAVIYYKLGIGDTATYTSSGIRIMSVEFGYILFTFLICLCIYLETHNSIYFGVLVITFIGLIPTFQRSAFVGLAVGLLIIIIIARTHSTLLAIFMCICTVYLITFAYTHITTERTEIFNALTERLASIAQYKQDTSAQHRLTEWKTALAAIEAHPVIGNGFGYIITFYSPMYSSYDKQFGFVSKNIYIHNSYIWIFVKMGAIGIILFLSMVLAFIKYGLKSIKAYRSCSGHGYLLGLFASVVSLCVVSFFEPLFNVDNVSPFVGFACGAVAAALGRRTEAGAGRARALCGALADSAECHSTV